MAQRTDTLDLATLKLTSGEGRRLDGLTVELEPLDFGGETYAVIPEKIPVVVDVSRMTGGGYALRLRFEAGLRGPCMRCLQPAEPSWTIDAREVDVPGETGEDLSSPYVQGEDLDLHAWARDAFHLALPGTILCRADCRGLCAECGIDLNTAEPGHHHERGPDPRWAKLRELDLGSAAADD